MKRPIEPIAPYKPLEPLKPDAVIKKQEDISLEDFDNLPLDDFLKKLKQSTGQYKIFVSKYFSYEGDIIQFSYFVESQKPESLLIRENNAYNKAYKSFLKQKEKYEQDCKIYDAKYSQYLLDLKIYEDYNKQKEIQILENKLKKLKEK